MDECRKALEVLVDASHKMSGAAMVNDVQVWSDALLELEQATGAAEAALAARTEAKVSGEVVSADAHARGDELRLAFMHGAKWWEFHSTRGTMWQSDQRLVAEAAERRYHGSVMELPAPQSPMSTSLDGIPKRVVLWDGEPTECVRTSDIGGAQSPSLLASLPTGKWVVTVTDEHNGSVERYEEAQSPVVPSLQDIQDICERWWEIVPKGFHDEVEPGSESTYWGSLSKAIHAHLLANARGSREDDALNKELDVPQRKSFDEFVTMANGYREALEDFLRGHALDHLGYAKLDPCKCDACSSFRKALATVGKEG